MNDKSPVSENNEKVAWKEGYESAFSCVSQNTRLGQELRKSLPIGASAFALGPNALNLIRELNKKSDWGREKRRAFVSGLIQGLSEIASLDSKVRN